MSTLRNKKIATTILSAIDLPKMVPDGCDISESKSIGILYMSYNI